MWNEIFSFCLTFGFILLFIFLIMSFCNCFLFNLCILSNLETTNFLSQEILAQYDPKIYPLESCNLEMSRKGEGVLKYQMVNLKSIIFKIYMQREFPSES